MHVCFADMYVHVPHECLVALGAGGGHSSLGAAAVGDLGLPCRCWELTFGPLQNQLVILPGEPSPLPVSVVLKLLTNLESLTIHCEIFTEARKINKRCFLKNTSLV